MAPSKGKEKPKKLIAFIEDQEASDAIKEGLKEINLENSEFFQGGVKEAIEFFSHNRSPEYLIIDISKSDLPISDLSKLSEVCEPGVNVLAIGIRDDIGLYRDLMKLGIMEYLVKPLFAEIISRALKSMIFGEEGDKASKIKLGKIITLQGARGGVGTSFLTTNLAAILANERSRRVIVVDMDIHFGTVALYFNLKSNDGLNTALEDPERVDQLFLERLFIAVNERLNILTSEVPINETKNYSQDSIKQLLSYLSKLFHYVIVDIPHNFDEAAGFILQRSNIHILVTETSLAGLRDSGRIIRYLGEDQLNYRLILVLNKFIKEGEGKLSPEDFENTLKRKVDHLIPYEASINNELINAGKTVLEIDTPLKRPIQEIANNIQGIKDEEKATHSIWNFFKR
ncbi:AAA family ATPase [Kamptonema cortianum]|jgi:pilus assembly protein CpaE|nr:AAA family ATPase [Geitlerinema splendidum]MDK3161253.1 AAA family ATPase [Kamptonema cortianum]